MADLTTTSQITIRHWGRQRPDPAGPGIGATLSALSKAMAQAFSMVYVEPYRTTRRQLPDTVDTDADGRDPRW
jgi:hypothetical protein